MMNLIGDILLLFFCWSVMELIFDPLMTLLYYIFVVPLGILHYIVSIPAAIFSKFCNLKDEEKKDEKKPEEKK